MCGAIHPSPNWLQTTKRFQLLPYTGSFAINRARDLANTSSWGMNTVCGSFAMAIRSRRVRRIASSCVLASISAISRSSTSPLGSSGKIVSMHGLTWEFRLFYLNVKRPLALQTVFCAYCVQNPKSRLNHPNPACHQGKILPVPTAIHKARHP